jgi:hypothetical protein
MKKFLRISMIMVSFIFVFAPATLIAYPTVYPRGTTVYKPDKCWNGYTIIPTSFATEKGRELVKDEGAYLIDMNGNVVKFWKGVYGAYSNKVLPGGYIMGTTGITPGLRQRRGNINIAQWDWDGNIVWKFDRAEKVKIGDKWIWSAIQHHDYQREGNPVGYYVPGMDPLVDRGKTLFNSRKIVNRPDITDKPIADTWVIEVTWDGKIVWEWLITDHWDELGLSEAAKNAYYRNPGIRLVFNNINYLGPNKWYDAGDERFHPDNIITDIRGLNISLIISKKTGKIVWRLGPYFTDTPALRKIRQIIGQHHVHMIPKGLPGAGNILIFDNGGEAGYGSPNPTAPKGVYNARRHYSRILEIDPVTLEIVWEYRNSKFFSPYASGMQRLPNGNTLITESLTARVFEVTPGKEIVWEYIRPNEGDGVVPVFRAYRIPYDWIPQLKKKPIEQAVIPPEPSKFIIKPSNRPSIKITGPANGYYDSGQAVLLEAQATAYGGSKVHRVEFVVDGKTIASDTDAPYVFNWVGALKGRHSIRAKVYDSKGRTKESSPVTIFVDMRVLERFVTRSTDDTEELADGSMYIDSSDLELIRDDNQRGDQVVGIRFTDIRIPRGAQIKRAYLQFMVAEVSTEETDLTIHAELVDNANAFEVVHRNITSRQKTTASVKWSPESWNVIGERSEKQRTPNLSSLIQEVIARPSWHVGNALVLIISGSGRRTAESCDGDQQNAPMLYIEY